MIGRALKLAFVAAQVLWMLVVLPGHVRGQVVLGSDKCCVSTASATTSTATDATTATSTTDASDSESCCTSKSVHSKPTRPDQDPDRRSRCAVCNQALGYALPPVFDFDPAPTGLCRLRLLIGPTRLHHQAVRPTYLANGPPDA